MDALLYIQGCGQLCIEEYGQLAGIDHVTMT